VPIQRIATYRPAWTSGGERVRGWDEDGTTMAVAAGSLLLGAPDPVTPQRVIFVTRTPDLLEGPTEAVLRAALRLGAGVPVELRLGGAPAALDALATAPEGTLLLTSDPDAPAAAAAAWIAGTGVGLTVTGRSDTALPARVRPAGEDALVYDDPRLLRERGWRPAVAAAVGAAADSASRGHPRTPGSSPGLITGVPARAAAALGGRRDLADVGALGASAPLFGLAALAGSSGESVLVGVDGGAAAAVAVTGAAGLEVRREERAATPARADNADTTSRIPSSAAAYERAFAAKVGLLAGRCECGAAEIPPRYLCLECGREGASELVPLPHSAEVYSAVTIHTAVPGRPTPYSLAVVEIDGPVSFGVGVRLLAPITDVVAGTAAIGDRGRLVLRRLADRETGPDYGYAFQPQVARQEGRAA
jgi:uncharacterized OB-fold protein